MPLYEHVLIARQDVSQQQVETLVETFKNVITENGGTVSKVEPWGLRTMQYKIKKNRKGHYTLMNIEASHEAVMEMERQMKLNEDIIRFMTIRVEEHEEGPSAILQSRGRDDRRGPRRDDRGPRRDDRGPREDRDRPSKPAEQEPAETQTEAEA
jgi:small subunit ribosomal protein S6